LIHAYLIYIIPENVTEIALFIGTISQIILM